PVSPLKILFVAAECAPFFKVGGLADVVGSLPLALKELGHEVRVIVPRYRPINGKLFGFKRVDRFIDVPAGAEARRTEIVESTFSGVRTYFVWDERFFGRDRVYGEPDEVVAFAFFSRAAVEFVRALDWTPDVIHAHDWHTGCTLAQLALRERREPRLKSIATVFTIHNLLYQGLSGDALWKFAGFPDRPRRIMGEPPGRVNWLARGIAHADVVNTVSPTYAAEILTPAMGEGLDGLLRARRGQISGILNGLDYAEWNPATDARLAATFTADSLKARAINKRAVQEQLGLKRKPRTPLIGLVTRLYDQKGFDLIVAAADRLFERDVQLVVLGSGDEKYHTALAELKARYPGRVGVEHNFNEPLARLIYGGSDLFLMPSHFEPCGLGQLIAMRYGSVPLVRATGGLVDTVIDAGRAPARGTGFVFKPATAAGVLGALDRALAAYQDLARWQAIQRRGMSADFSWQVSAQQYVELYQAAIKAHRK
ncbi:MAG: glycogen synthase GlgA, partial [Chloroflexi bacterium]|nr:glycogen synthase GlgA [Chloroflexota bacterium]